MERFVSLAAFFFGEDAIFLVQDDKESAGFFVKKLQKSAFFQKTENWHAVCYYIGRTRSKPLASPS